MFLELLVEPLGAGAIVLLTVLLLVSTLIAVRHFPKVKSADDFLIAGYRGKWYDFTFSQIAYVVGVATTIVLFPSLSYTYGPIVIPITVVAWIIAIGVVGYLIKKNKELKEYLKTDYGLANFIAGNFAECRGRTFLIYVSSIIIALVYWGLFGVELIALQIMFGEMFPDISTFPILVLCFVLVIVYVGLGGYLSTMRTDGIQTAVFIIIMTYFSFYVLPDQFGSTNVPDILSFEMFSKNPNVPWEDVGVFAIAWILLGVGFLLVSQDLWSRSAAVSHHRDLRNTRIGLVGSILAIIPYTAILMWGLYMFTIDPDIASYSDLEQIVPTLINQMAGKAPVGLLLATLIAIAISTADTALITSTQAMSSIKKQWFDTPWKCRVWTVILGLIGLSMAYAFPSIISGVFLLSSLPLIFLPLIVARMTKWKRRKVWVANTVLILGVLIALGICFFGGPEGAQFYPIIVFFFSILLYPLLQILPIGGKNGGT